MACVHSVIEFNRNVERLTKLFAFAANSDPSAVKDVEEDPVFSAFIARARTEYAHAEGVRFLPETDHQDVG